MIKTKTNVEPREKAQTAIGGALNDFSQKEHIPPGITAETFDQVVSANLSEKRAAMISCG